MGLHGQTRLGKTTLVKETFIITSLIIFEVLFVILYYFSYYTTYMLDILLATTSSEAKHCMELFKGFGQDSKRLY